MLEASGVFAYGVQVTESILAPLKPGLDRLDGLLAFMIDPDGVAWPWGALARDFGFPDDDLEQLELDAL